MWRRVLESCKSRQSSRALPQNTPFSGSPRRWSAGITLLEFSICFLIAFMALGVVVMRLEGALVQTKEVALAAELRNMRRALKVYYVFNQGYPNDIRTLFGRGSTLFGSAQSAFNPDLLKSLAQDPNGYPMDPFGARYTYDPIVGQLRSVSSGYEQW